MNEVKKCSIAGVAFTLDAEAYNELSHYLDSLHTAYKDAPEGSEIIADIEARIAELILSAQDGGQVVETPLIRNIIRQLGTAEDISDQEHVREEAPQPEAPRIPRRLYRDMDNAKLGGVCAGLGKYFDIDPIWIRLAMFLPLVVQIPFRFYWMQRLGGNLFGLCVLSYVIMWFVVPVARSARQKLEQNGSPITARSVASATSTADDSDRKAKSAVAEVVSAFGAVIAIILKLFAGVIVLGLILAACALVIGLLCVVIGGYDFLHVDPVQYSIWLPISGILSVLIFVLLLIYVFMSLIASRKPNGKTILATFLLWLVAIVSCVWFGVKAKHTMEFGETFQYSRTRVERPNMEDLREQLNELEEASADESNDPIPASATDATDEAPQEAAE